VRQYLASADALFFHQQLIERYGGSSGVRDAGALESALHRPQSGYYDTLIQEAAALLESLVQTIPSCTGTSGSPSPRRCLFADQWPFDHRDLDGDLR
jgi:hypothetical protein